MSRARRLSVDGHRGRADEHERLGRLLAETGHEWAAVALFYAAYHHVKASLLEDALFDDHEACQKRNPDLLPEDRYTTRHNGRRYTSNGREWGLNELVFLLYRPVAGVYDKLHQASNDVRYQSGLKAHPTEILSLYEDFLRLRDAGALTSGHDPVV